MDQPVDRTAVNRRRRWQWMAGVAAVVLIGAFLYPSVRRWAQSATSVELSRVRLGEVTRGDLVRDVSVQGNVVAAYRPTLVSPARGTVGVETRDGRVVAAGEVLLRVESPELNSRVAQERSALLSLKADYERQRILAKQAQIQSEEDLGLLRVELEAAERAMARAEKTRGEGLLNEVEYEAAQDHLKVARLKLELAEQRAKFELETLAFDVQDRASRAERQQLVLRDLERQVDDLAVRAPVAGLVSRVQVNDGDTVERGDVLVTVVDLSAFEIEIAVPENYADELLPGTPAEVTYDGRDYMAAVKNISPVVEGSRVRGVLAFRGESPEGLKQNQRLSVRVILETRQNVVKVPRGPFLESGGGRQAYVIDDGTAVLRPIEVGALSISEVEIVSGLALGDRIIISDMARFRGAERILLRN
jgi:HlyD family secretion protein